MFDNLIDKFKDVIQNQSVPYDDDQYDDGYNEEYFNDYDYAEPEPAKSKVTSIAVAKTRKATTSSPAKVVNINASVSMQVTVLAPKSLDEAEAICKDLQERKTVVINLEDTEIEVAQRISDFLCGACYALDGNVQAISDEIIMICPHNVKITNNLKQALAANGLKFPKSALTH